MLHPGLENLSEFKNDKIVPFIRKKQTEAFTEGTAEANINCPCYFPPAMFKILSLLNYNNCPLKVMFTNIGSQFHYIIKLANGENKEKAASKQ